MPDDVSNVMNLLAHLKYAFRQINKNPGFFGIALAALALGIGANTAIFSAVEAMLLRPLPFMQPSRLVIVWEDASFVGFQFNTPAPANLHRLASKEPGVQRHGGHAVHQR